MGKTQRTKYVPAYQFKILDTRLPFLRQLHTREGRFIPMYVLVELRDGSQLAFQGIVEVPDSFNDPMLRKRMAVQIVTKGAPMSLRQAGAHFNVSLEAYAKDI